MALITVDEIEQQLLTTLTDDQRTLVTEQLIPQAHEDARAFMRREIEAGVTISNERHPLDDRVIHWPYVSVRRGPIASVTSITVDSVTIPPAGYVDRGNIVEFLYTTPFPISLTGVPIMLITYIAAIPSAGAEAVPQVLRSRVKRELMASIAQSQALERGEAGLKTLAVEGYQTTYDTAVSAAKARALDDDGAAFGFTGEEIRSLPNRRRVMR